MEMKWAMIGVIVVMGLGMTGMALEQYERNQCRIAAIQAGKNSTDIETICK